MDEVTLATRKSGETARSFVGEAYTTTVILSPHVALMRSYCYPTIPPFESPMLNWHNLLYFTSGWDDVTLIERVNAGLKTAAGLVFDTEAELQHAVALIDPRLDYDFRKPRLNPGSEKHFLNLYPDTTPDQLFNVYDVLAHYYDLGVDFEDHEVEELLKLVSLPFALLLGADAHPKHGYCVTSPTHGVQRVLTGLIFGYPLESTASILCE